MLRLVVPAALEARVRALLATGLHGRSVQEAAERMLARGVEVTVNSHGFGGRS